jgi:hypothetical protein
MGVDASNPVPITLSTVFTVLMLGVAAAFACALATALHPYGFNSVI